MGFARGVPGMCQGSGLGDLVARFEPELQAVGVGVELAVAEQDLEPGQGPAAEAGFEAPGLRIAAETGGIHPRQRAQAPSFFMAVRYSSRPSRQNMPAETMSGM